MEKQLGLSQAEAEKRLVESGPNVLPEKPPTSDLTIIIRQFQSPLIYILLIAAAISYWLSDVTDALVILLAVTVNTILGFYQERKAERGLTALKRILSPQARVVRDGRTQMVVVQNIVPGDIVILSAGDRVPADGVVIEASELTVDEAILTGESVPVVKESVKRQASSVDNTATKNYEQSSANSKVFMGTTVIGGLGKVQVVATGIGTEMGKIATSLAETKEEPTPLQVRLAGLARTLTLVVAFSAVVIFIVGIVRGESWVEIFTTSVAVAVAAIPEGLVIALTAILALGMQRILKRKALVRKLVVAETLGTVTVIATDKTGTLTEGKLQVVKTDFVNHDEALRAATFANHLIDPLELALWEWLTAQSKFDPEELLATHPRHFLLPFDAERKFSATVYQHAIYVLGAPETIITKSTLTDEERTKVEKKIEEWGRKGLRLLALGWRPGSRSHTLVRLKEEHDIRNIEFLGLIGFADPVRKSVKEALSLAKEAGIAVKVVTGDYRWTAEVVMRQVGLKITHPQTQIIEGEELDRLTPEELHKRVSEVLLFARVSPGQKLKIVEALKNRGEVVALLGDGVNDAPALKRADIGIVVAEATDVARETADLVLLDSNFATIVAAVEEGRGIFANIQKVMTYLLGDTFAEVTLIFLGLIFGVPLPLTAAQILWINLVTDIFPTLALTLEPKEAGLLKKSPISPDLPILSKSIIAFMLVASLTSGIVIFALFLFIWRSTGDLATARLVAFTAFSIKSLVYVFSLRERTRMLWQTSLFSNLYLLGAVGVSFCLQLIAVYGSTFQKLLNTRGLTFTEWGWVIGASLIILIVIELAKVARTWLKSFVKA